MRRVNACRCDLLQLRHREQVAIAPESSASTVFDPTVFGEHSHVRVEHPVVRVSPVVAIDLRLQFSPSAITHQEPDVSGHVAFESVVEVEPLELQLPLQLFVNRNPLLLQLVDAEGDHAEHVEYVHYPTAVTPGQLGVEPGDLSPVLAGETGFEHFRTFQLVGLVPVDIVRIFGQYAGEDAVQRGG